MGVRITDPCLATFIHMKKTGGTSLQNWLLHNTKSFDFSKHEGYDRAKNRFGELGFTFTIVRHPLDRYVSWYFYMLNKTKARLHKVKTSKKILKNTKKLTTKYDVERNQALLEVLEKGFNYYTQNNLLNNITPQYPNASQCDYVLKLENLNEDMKVLKQKFSIQHDIPHLLRSKRPSNFIELYDQKTLDIIYDLHKEDFDHLGYKINNSSS